MDFASFSTARTGTSPFHVHIEYGEAKAKFWMDPIGLASSYRMRSKDLRRARVLLEEHENLIKEKWHEYFGNRG